MRSRTPRRKRTQKRRQRTQKRTPSRRTRRRSRRTRRRSRVQSGAGDVKLSEVENIEIKRYKRGEGGVVVYYMTIHYNDKHTETYNIRWSQAAENAKRLQSTMEKNFNVNFAKEEDRKEGELEKFRSKTNVKKLSDIKVEKRAVQMSRYFNGLVEWVKKYVSLPNYKPNPPTLSTDCICDTSGATSENDHDLCSICTDNDKKGRDYKTALSEYNEMARKQTIARKLHISLESPLPPPYGTPSKIDTGEIQSRVAIVQSAREGRGKASVEKASVE